MEEGEDELCYSRGYQVAGEWVGRRLSIVVLHHELENGDAQRLVVEVVCSAPGMEPKEIVQFDEPQVEEMFKDRKPIASIMQGKEFAIYFKDGSNVGASELKKIKAEWKRISKEKQ